MRTERYRQYQHRPAGVFTLTMLKKKASSAEKRRKQSQTEERADNNKRRCADANSEGSKDDLADAELDRIGSDIEEGGWTSAWPSSPSPPTSLTRRRCCSNVCTSSGRRSYARCCPRNSRGNQKDVLGSTGAHLRAKSHSDSSRGRLTSGNTEETLESHLKETAKPEDPKQEGSGEESDVLSINADTYDSDIEGHKEEQAAVNPAAVNPATINPAPPTAPPPEAKKDLQSDIDRSVSEILALSAGTEEAKEQSVAPPQCTDVSSPVAPPVSGRAPAGGPPSLQQLELLELEMRARAIKALMKASDGKKLCVAKNV
ncbi:hypothetical protein F7725_004481 [Dissostichus mawsoni]|uniref:Uncharacterized protein n=1 Tax=Dissostichus mawsoni TaxID=36200 RepID=A0A7J5XK78_DISMA|nr:hypothetical protein F7725_004481 [Dissostichus mawsoni]